MVERISLLEGEDGLFEVVVSLDLCHLDELVVRGIVVFPLTDIIVGLSDDVSPDLPA